MRRVLFISYYFPPSAGPGVQRTLKFVKYLGESGWEPVVLTVRPEDASYPGLDPALNDEVPPGVFVQRTRARDPYAAYAKMLGKSKQETVGVAFIDEQEANWKQRLAKWVRANLFIPDARVGWVPYAIRAGRSLIEAKKIDLLFSTGPPHSSHLIARSLHRRYGIPWVADFRDPWTDISYYRELPLTGPARRLDAGLERTVLKEATAVLTVSPSLQKLLSFKTKRPITVIPNGYDESDFKEALPVDPDQFVLSHVGNLAASQNPVVLWRVLAGLRGEGAVPELRLRFTGNVDALCRRSLQELGLDQVTEWVPYVPHREAVRHMTGAALLLLCINRVPDSAGIVTGKIFEYIASGRPVIGIGKVDGDAAALLHRTQAGRMFDWDDEAGVEAYIREAYNRWKSKDGLLGATPGSARIYSRRNETEHLARLFDSLVEHSNETAEQPYW